MKVLTLLIGQNPNEQYYPRTPPQAQNHYNRFTPSQTTQISSKLLPYTYKIFHKKHPSFSTQTFPSKHTILSRTHYTEGKHTDKETVNFLPNYQNFASFFFQISRHSIPTAHIGSFEVACFTLNSQIAENDSSISNSQNHTIQTRI